MSSPLSVHPHVKPLLSLEGYAGNGRRNITQSSIEVDAETKESTRKTE